MTETNAKFSEALTYVPGIWESDSTNDTWHFKTPKGKGYTTLEIFQNKSGMKITCAYKVILDNKICYIEIDNTFFEVLDLSTSDIVTMKLEGPSGHAIMFSKKHNDQAQ
jgi:hypothetical protein